MPDVRFDTYYRYDDLTRLLREFAEEYPQLVRLESIGHSHEGRDIWLLTVTRFEMGEAEAKPALWVDGKAVLTSKDTQYTARKEDIRQLMDDVIARQGELPAPTVGILAQGGASELWHIKLMRDVYYTCPTLVEADPRGGDRRTDDLGHGTTDNPKTLRRFLQAPDLDETALEMARAIAENSPGAVRFSKAVIDMATIVQEAVEREQRANVELWASDDHRRRFGEATERLAGGAPGE